MGAEPGRGGRQPEPSLAASVVAALDAQGPFQRAHDGFRARDVQLSLAGAIAQAIEATEPLIGEAGTGTGKTFAYLVPAVLSERRTLISTGTKHLQEQLFRRDLPAVLTVLGVSPVAALLKGRANYVCRHHLAKNLAEGRFERRDDVAVMRRIERFAAISATGDRSEAPGIAEDHPAWLRATSTRENCLGQDCEHQEACFVLMARRRAMQADLIVINHHLFCADLALRDEGVSELLPSTEVLVFDEAHHLPSVATQFFGTAVSTRQLAELARDVVRIGQSDARDAADWSNEAIRLEASLRDMRATAGPPSRLDAQRLRGLAAFVSALQRGVDVLDALSLLLEASAQRSRDLDKLAARCAESRGRLDGWLAELLADERADERGGERDGAMRAGAAQASVPDSDGDAESRIRSDGDEDAVVWADVHSTGFTLHRTPLSVAETFRRARLSQPKSWIFLSATLSVGGKFDYFQDRMGLEGVRTLLSPSPFDFDRNTLLYVPTSCREPSSPDFAERMLEAIIPLVRRNEGRAFVLCTSLKMVARIASGLADGLSNDAHGFDLIVQGSMPRPEMLRRFHAARRPVLVGSASFWEGVDVVGDQLSLVIIDKLPFAPPDDPVVRARTEGARRRGLDPFRSFQVPEAAMALKQGAGRLIRSESDRGLLVVCDPRLVTRPYGRLIRESLPPFPLTRSEGAALAFLDGPSE